MELQDGIEKVAWGAGEERRSLGDVLHSCAEVGDAWRVMSLRLVRAQVWLLEVPTIGHWCPEETRNN